MTGLDFSLIPFIFTKMVFVLFFVPLCSCLLEAASELVCLIVEVNAVDFPLVHICSWFIVSLFCMQCLYFANACERGRTRGARAHSNQIAHALQCHQRQIVNSKLQGVIFSLWMLYYFVTALWSIHIWIFLEFILQRICWFSWIGSIVYMSVHDYACMCI